MQLILNQHEGQPQSKVLFIIRTAGGLSLPPSTPPFTYSMLFSDQSQLVLSYQLFKMKGG